VTERVQIFTYQIFTLILTEPGTIISRLSRLKEYPPPFRVRVRSRLVRKPDRELGFRGLHAFYVATLMMFLAAFAWEVA
jgi:hypothetical protein